jgi:hypothetical protein
VNTGFLQLFEASVSVRAAKAIMEIYVSGFWNTDSLMTCKVMLIEAPFSM